mmetsp:Transcript_93068/g.262797  ORF Transcript_93068/g.262797 Transcript_93068/m.262797 type:complete len:242 (-) Transcript_93068:1510-2235(-)
MHSVEDSGLAHTMLLLMTPAHHDSAPCAEVLEHRPNVDFATEEVLRHWRNFMSEGRVQDFRQGDLHVTTSSAASDPRRTPLTEVTNRAPRRAWDAWHAWRSWAAGSQNARPPPGIARNSHGGADSRGAAAMRLHLRQQPRLLRTLATEVAHVVAVARGFLAISRARGLNAALGAATLVWALRGATGAFGPKAPRATGTGGAARARAAGASAAAPAAGKGCGWACTKSLRRGTAMPRGGEGR